MSRGFIDDSYLTGIADTIRAKTGSSSRMTPRQMINAINNMGSSILNVASVPGIAFAESSFQSIPVNSLDFSSVENFNKMFYNCTSLSNIDNVNFTNGTDFTDCFTWCYGLRTIGELNICKARNTIRMFEYCYNLTNVQNLNTCSMRNVTNMFGRCNNLTDLGPMDCSNVYLGINSMFTAGLLGIHSIRNLVNMGGLINFGNAFSTTASANSDIYKLSLRDASNLTHESLMNLITNLYNIANKGCNIQKINLGSSLSKLNSDEIAIATNKGWSLE